MLNIVRSPAAEDKSNLNKRKLNNFSELFNSNSNWTEWSTIQGVIARVISKSDEHSSIPIKTIIFVGVFQKVSNFSMERLILHAKLACFRISVEGEGGEHTDEYTHGT